MLERTGSEFFQPGDAQVLAVQTLGLPGRDAFAGRGDPGGGFQLAGLPHFFQRGKRDPLSLIRVFSSVAGGQEAQRAHRSGQKQVFQRLVFPDAALHRKIIERALKLAYHVPVGVGRTVHAGRRVGDVHLFRGREQRVLHVHAAGAAHIQGIRRNVPAGKLSHFCPLLAGEHAVSAVPRVGGLPHQEQRFNPAHAQPLAGSNADRVPALGQAFHNHGIQRPGRKLLQCRKAQRSFAQHRAHLVEAVYEEVGKPYIHLRLSRQPQFQQFLPVVFRLFKAIPLCKVFEYRPELPFQRLCGAQGLLEREYGRHQFLAYRLRLVYHSLVAPGKGARKRAHAQPERGHVAAQRLDLPAFKPRKAGLAQLGQVLRLARYYLERLVQERGQRSRDGASAVLDKIVYAVPAKGGLDGVTVGILVLQRHGDVRKAPAPRPDQFPDGGGHVLGLLHGVQKHAGVHAARSIRLFLTVGVQAGKRE